MTQIQRERILELQDAGLGYKKIAAELGISVNTVKSFCRRQRLKMYDAFACNAAARSNSHQGCGKRNSVRTNAGPSGGTGIRSSSSVKRCSI